MPIPSPALSPSDYVGRTAFPTTAGILTIIAACMMAIIGIVGLAVSFADILDMYYWRSYFQWLFMGIFCIIGFAFGLAGGIFALKRRRFALSIVGIGMVLVSGFVAMISLAILGSGVLRTGLLVGLSPVILSILSIVFTAVSKGEFA
jgi:hypothetical protein